MRFQMANQESSNQEFQKPTDEEMFDLGLSKRDVNYYNAWQSISEMARESLE